MDLLDVEELKGGQVVTGHGEEVNHGLQIGKSVTKKQKNEDRQTSFRYLCILQNS